MSSIDKRIVQMEFDNKGFENGVKTTLNSLKNLNEKLKMQNSSKGLNDISNAAKKVSFSGIENGIDSISSRFSNLGVIGTTALVNLTNSAVNAGKNLVKSFAISPVLDGFNEYELKMNSIQTILTNTAHQGTTLKDVTKTLDELNTYADKTIYNFAEMTKNIGTFTAAGVDLQTSTDAIKGIANLAAASGSNPVQASSVMYQLSQALAAGKVTMQDWNSVINGGMGGKLFQDALIRTSEVMGTGADAAIKKYGSFKESLTRGEWLTSDVLVETLKQISGAYTEAELKAQGYSDAQAKAIVQLADNATKAATEVKTFTQLIDTMKESIGSGWAKSFEYIFGDKNQATKLWTGISDAFSNIVNESANARNDALKVWNQGGGRDDVLKGLTNIVQSVGKGLGSVKDAFRDIFPAMTGERLNEISKGFKDLTEKFKMSDATASKIKNTFKGVFSVLNLGKNAVVTLFKAFTPLTSIFSGMGNVFLTVTSAIGKFASGLNDAANKSNFFGKISDGISNALNGIGSVIGGAGKTITSFFGYLSKLDFSKVFGTIGDVLQGLGNGIAPILEGLGKALGSIDFGVIFGGINTILAGGMLKTIKEGIESMKSTVKQATSFFDSIKNAGKAVTEVLDSVKESLEAYTKDIKAGTLLKIAGAIGILAVSLMTLSMIDEGKLDSALSGITVLLIELLGAMAILEAINIKKGLFAMQGVATGMQGIAIAILILSVAMKQLSDLDWGQIAKGLTSITVLTGIMIASSKLMSGSSKGLVKTAAAMVIFAVAIKSFAKSVESLGKIDAGELTKGLVGLGTVMAEIVAFAKLMDGVKMGLGNATGILILAGALNVLAMVVKEFGSMDLGGLMQGLAGIGLILTELAVFSYFGTASGGLIATAVGLTVLAGAMNILSFAIKSLGSLSWEQLAIGLTSMAGALTILGLATALIPPTMSMTAIGIGLMAGALLVLSAALQSLGSQSWEGVAISLVSLAGALTILGVAMYAMSGCILGATAMVIMAGALALLTPQLMALSSLSLQEVGIGLLALAGAFTVIGVAGLLLTPVIPTLFGLAGAIALLSLSCATIGLGLLAFGTGLTLVATVITGSGFAILEFLRQLINLLPTLGTKLAEAITNLITGLAEGVPQIASAMTTLITGMLEALTNAIPQITEAAVKLVTALAEAIGNAAPKLATVAVKLILALLKGISENVGKLVTVGADIIAKFLNGIANNIGKVIDAGMNLAIKFINGVADGLRNNQGQLESAIRNLIDAVITTGLGVITGAISQFVESGAKLIGGFIKGIGQKLGEAKNAVSKVVNNAVQGAANCGTKLISAGKELIGGFLKGVEEKASAIRDRISSLAGSLADAAREKLKIFSPSRVFMEIGRYTVLGLANGITKYSRYVTSPSEGLADKVIGTVSNSIAKIKDVMSSDIDPTPVITPVLDLSDIDDKTDRLDRMLSGRTMSIAGSSNGLLKSIGSVQNGNDNSDIVSAIKDLRRDIGNTNNTTYQINGVTYDDGSNIANAVETIVRATKMERRM